MLKPYFVMLHCQNGGITPMMQDEDEIATYDSLEEACFAAEDNLLGFTFGFEVFKRGMGC